MNYKQAQELKKKFNEQLRPFLKNYIEERKTEKENFKKLQKEQKELVDNIEFVASLIKDDVKYQETKSFSFKMGKSVDECEKYNITPEFYNMIKTSNKLGEIKNKMFKSEILILIYVYNKDIANAVKCLEEYKNLLHETDEYMSENTDSLKGYITEGDSGKKTLWGGEGYYLELSVINKNTMETFEQYIDLVNRVLIADEVKEAKRKMKKRKKGKK
jgi:hypothetical protein